MKDQKQFILWDPRDGKFPRYQDDGVTFLSDGIMGRIGRDNAYLKAYPDFSQSSWPKGCSSLDDLQVGQCVTGVLYSLSGSKGWYDIYRVQDAPPPPKRIKAKVVVEVEIECDPNLSPQEVADEVSSGMEYSMEYHHQGTRIVGTEVLGVEKE